RDWFGWWGASLFLGGIAGLAAAAAIHPVFRWTFQSLLLPRLPFTPPPSLADAARDLIAAILTDVAAPIAIQSILILLAGIVLLLAMRFRKSTATVPSAAPPIKPEEKLQAAPPVVNPQVEPEENPPSVAPQPDEKQVEIREERG
ncbi:MAG: hypothetical protein AB1750_12820, partial [Chloroflexota bacterium]